MLSPNLKTKRFFEKIQVVLTFASVCTVADASFIHVRPHDEAGYYAGRPQHGEAREDTLGELARTERRRREAALREALEQRPLRA